MGLRQSLPGELGQLGGEATLADYAQLKNARASMFDFLAMYLTPSVSSRNATRY